MSIFVCSKCGAMDNTALAVASEEMVENSPLRCRECKTGQWHDQFTKQTPTEHWCIGGYSFMLIRNTYPYELYEYDGEEYIHNRVSDIIEQVTGIGTVQITPKIYKTDVKWYAWSPGWVKEIEKEFGIKMKAIRKQTGHIYFYLR